MCRISKLVSLLAEPLIWADKLGLELLSLQGNLAGKIGETIHAESKAPASNAPTSNAVVFRNGSKILIVRSEHFPVRLI